MSKFTDKIKHSVSNVKRNMTFKKKKHVEPHTKEEQKEIQPSADVKESLESESTLSVAPSAEEAETVVGEQLAIAKEPPTEAEQLAVVEKEIPAVEPVPIVEQVAEEVTKVETKTELVPAPIVEKSVAKRKWWVPLTIFGWVGAMGALGIMVYARQSNFFKHIY
ncbi:hypothetical protein HDV06_005903 [Boothiomyces sp. JEL0866]|nr:hypothetical protein HDV06_005903 [Boothiomyces sp. JEL0866]